MKSSDGPGFSLFKTANSIKSLEYEHMAKRVNGTRREA